jgi:amino-acid N-acetyltransferase
MKIRSARAQDVPGIAALVSHQARQGQLLPRSEENICASIDDWIVIVQGGRVIACVSLLHYSDALVEVRSLAVDSAYQGQGLGKKIIARLIEEARVRSTHTLFALTRAVPFFESAGFRKTEKIWFPQKVWRDCALCPFLENCDEQAVVLDLRLNAEAPRFIPLALKGT